MRMCRCPLGFVVGRFYFLPIRCFKKGSEKRAAGGFKTLDRRMFPRVWSFARMRSREACDIVKIYRRSAKASRSGAAISSATS